MDVDKGRSSVSRMLRPVSLVVMAAGCLLVPRQTPAQGLTGALIGTVKDQPGGVLTGALVTVSSPALMGTRQN